MDRLIFDLETTGPDSSKDRIVQLAIKVINEKGEVLVNKSKMYNPGIPISPEATKIHGISDKQVKNCPFFKEDAKKLKTLFENKIIVGYNCMVFDIPIIMNEFDRAKVEVELSGKYIDVFRIEQKLTPKTLSNVYKSYTGKDLEDAHDAQADINATHIVLNAQIEKLQSSEKSYDEEMLYELSGTKDIVDFHGKFARDNEGYLVFKFGKYKGRRILDEIAYSEWMLKENFPSQIKKLIKQEQKREIKKQFSKPSSSLKNELSNSKSIEDKMSGWKPLVSANTSYDDLPF